MAIEKEVLNQDLNNKSILTGNDENKELAEGNEVQCQSLEMNGAEKRVVKGKQFANIENPISDYEVNQVICGIIKEIYGNNLANNYPENITPAVIDIVTDAVNRIKASTLPLLGTHVAFSFLYTAPGTIYDVISGIVGDMWTNHLDPNTQDALQTYKDWFGAIRGNRIYSMSIPAAAMATRSGLELALMGI